jgi:hypothetical protein
MRLDQKDRSPLSGSAAAVVIRSGSPEARMRAASSGLKAGWGGVLDPAPEPAAAAFVRPSPCDENARSAEAQAAAKSAGFNHGSGGNGVVASGFAGTADGLGEVDSTLILATGRGVSIPSLGRTAESTSGDATGPCRIGPALGSLRASSLASARVNACSGPASSGATAGLTADAARATLRARAGVESDAGSRGSSALSSNRAVASCGGSSSSTEGSKASTTSGRSASEPRTVRRAGASFTGAAPATTRGVTSRGD